MKPVERMYSDHQDVLDYLAGQQQVSYHATLQTTLPKVLLLAAASEFEHRVSDILRDHVREHASDLKILHIIDQKALGRQYHSLFTWDARNANTFWALFGNDFKEGMKAYCREDSVLAAQIRAFLEIGDLRNQMVHNNYVNFVLEKTLDEVYGLYVEGDHFVSRLPELLKLDFDPS
ncbi:HEPN domain-containing protein [Nonomuraea fuscirosea]|uniref:HEPN domain-containing protein n=1 Tax=Nonomuraea fuscirosea TaxID=1291556 RepID=UPI002DDAEF26|nr:HEPN domain-containing protein [Nonomuraea fuscirosea]WSA48299.1 HEPN domain-containing protein [Nonomuraea fuscirosea]